MLSACYVGLSQVLGSADHRKQSTWKTFEIQNFSIQYPPDWELDTSGKSGTTFILFSKKESKKDPFRENITFIIQDLSKHDIDLNKFVEISENQINNQISKSTLLESNRIKQRGRELHYFKYTGEISPFLLKFEQYCWVQKKRAIILTFACEVNKYEDYKEIGEKILSTFKF